MGLLESGNCGQQQTEVFPAVTCESARTESSGDLNTCGAKLASGPEVTNAESPLESRNCENCTVFPPGAISSLAFVPGVLVVVKNFSGLEYFCAASVAARAEYTYASGEVFRETQLCLFANHFFP